MIGCSIFPCAGLPQRPGLGLGLPLTTQEQKHRDLLKQM